MCFFTVVDSIVFITYLAPNDVIIPYPLVVLGMWDGVDSSNRVESADSI